MRGSLLILISSFIALCIFVVIPYVLTLSADGLYRFTFICTCWETTFALIAFFGYKIDYDDFLDSKFPVKWLSLSAWTIYITSTLFKAMLPTLKKIVKFCDEWFSI